MYLAPSQLVADRMARVLPMAERVVVGCPRLDLIERRPVTSEVAVAWHWNPASRVPEAKSAYAHYNEALPELAQKHRVIGTAHPLILRLLTADYVNAGIEVVVDSTEVLSRAVVLIADNTSLMWEAAALDVPLVILDAPWYRRDVEHGLRFWEWADIAPRISTPEALGWAVEAALDPAWSRQRRAAADAIYGPQDGSATKRAVAAVMSWADRQV